jgi:hypothetical protein
VSDFLEALKADLLDRRVRALLMLLTAALIGAVAYAALGGGSSAPATALPTPTGSTRGAGNVTPTPAGANPNQALAEITSGSAKQRDGSTRNPFRPLPHASTGSSSVASAKGEGTPAASKLGTSTTGGSSPSSPKASTPAAPKKTYTASIALGVVPPGTAPQSAQLTPYENLKFQQKLPSPQLRLLAFEGTSSAGKKATFKLIGEAIPKTGSAVCTPSPAQCQSLTLESGQSEELEYLPPTGAAVVYELQVASIAEKH